MMKRLLFALPLLSLITLAALFAYQLLHMPDKAASQRRKETSLAAFRIPLLGAPDFALDSTLFKGTPVILNVFASWCVPCIAEHPVLMRLSRETDIRIYGINWKDTPEGVQKVLDLGNPYDGIGRDDTGEAAIALGITGAPETFIVDKHGKIVYHYGGPLTDALLDDEVLPLLETLQ